MTALRIFRTASASATLVGVVLTTAAWWRAMADLRMHAEQQWPYRCGFMGVAIMFTVSTAVLGLIWFMEHRDYRRHKAPPR